MKSDSHRIVLVGTYRHENEAWIRERRLYNLPLPEFISHKERKGRKEVRAVTQRPPQTAALPFHRNIGGNVLFAEGHSNFAFKAKFKDVVDGEWLKKNGYSLAAKPHGEKYALYELCEESTPARLLGRKTAEVVVSSSRCPCVKIDEAFYSKPYPVTGGKSMPYVFDCLKPYFRKWKSATTFDPVQEDFFQNSFGFDYGLQVARGIVEEAKRDGVLTCVEICAGAGGQALGLDKAGFKHVALVEYEKEYCDVLRANKPGWNVICGDVHEFDGTPYQGVDLRAGGVPCPPFSVASKQLGEDDERDLFPQAIRLISEIRPRAVMLENVRGFLDPKFDAYRNNILNAIRRLGYRVDIKLLQANDFGVPPIRPRVVIVGIRKEEGRSFSYPEVNRRAAPSVGEALRDMMGANGWRGLDTWVARANKIAPTIVGGSKKHGGPDLGPTRARRAWDELGVDGLGVANEPPARDFVGNPKLTKEMIARIQGFPSNWNFGKRKTAACRMIGNAFPPPVARAVGVQIRKVLSNEE